MTRASRVATSRRCDPDGNRPRSRSTSLADQKLFQQYVDFYGLNARPSGNDLYSWAQVLLTDAIL
jgi:hypothetical protein